MKEEPDRAVVGKHVVHDHLETQSRAKEQNKNIMAAGLRQAKDSANLIPDVVSRLSRLAGNAVHA